MSLKNETVLVCCAPLFVSLAERLARDFKKVYLYTPTSGSFVTMNAGLVGSGMEGVEKVDSIFGKTSNPSTFSVSRIWDTANFRSIWSR